MTKVIVAGALANKPGNGGEAWVRLSWALGLRRLGFEVLLVEEIADPSAEARDWFRDLTRRFGLERAACLVEGEGVASGGSSWEETISFAERASLLINLSGHLRAASILDRVAGRLFVDLDPGYTQLWTDAGPEGANLDGHDAFASVGLNLGDPRCSLPTAGHDWIPVLPPVLMDEWPRVQTAGRAFTTVGTWRNTLGTIEHEGHHFGPKAHGFRRIAGLPGEIANPFELALDIHRGDDRDRVALEGHGWQIVEPRQVASTPDAYRDYVSRSLAECSAAQPIYVETASGWFSDRTAHYLASGRPALVEDTGLDSLLPVGKGLLTFNSLDEAANGARAIVEDPDGQGTAARAFAEQHLDSDVVLGGLMGGLGVTA